MIPLALLAVLAFEAERAGAEEAIPILISQIVSESSWRPDAVSPAGAAGLGQFMPATWDEVAPATAPSCAGQPREHAPCAIRAMILYDRRLLRANREADSKRDRWALALSAYNGGQGWVNREARKCGAAEGCSPGRWPGNVQRVCLRAEWACRENKAYPGAITARVEAAFGRRARASFQASQGSVEASASFSF